MEPFFEKNKKWVFLYLLTAVCFFGYTVGKDMALRDNRSYGPHIVDSGTR